MYFAQIMAGGIGKRMGTTSMPKQFLTLGSKPILIHTLEKFVLQNEFEKIIVSCPKSWLQYAKDIIQKYVSDDRIVVIEGGKERNDTLNKAIQFIEEHYAIGEEDVLLVHDAVRPFVSRRIIEDNLKATQNYSAVDTGIPAFDTIVQVKDSLISNIPVRDEMYQGQTPQTFRIKTLKRCYEKLTESEKLILTDSCKICLLGGEDVVMVEGELSNIKITTPYDLKIANAILEERVQ